MFLKKLVTTFLILSSQPIFASAECESATHTHQAYGKWKLQSVGQDKSSYYMVIEQKNGFLDGYLQHSSGQRIGIQPCEGDCCDGFYKKNGKVHFWIKSPITPFVSEGRISLILENIDWNKGSATGQFRDHDFKKIIKVSAKKL
jgi:hypothetical protein